MDDALLEHMIENHLLPQLRAEQARAAGFDVEVAVVNTRPDAQGFPVACSRCGRTATLPFQIHEGSSVLCPRCQSAL